MSTSGVRWSTSGSAAVELELHRSEYPPEDQDPFQPLRLPDACAVSLLGPLPRCVRRGQVSIHLRLRPGSYSVPLSDGPPVQVEIPSGCEVRGSVSIGGANEGTGDPMIQALDLRFSAPLIIRNLVTALGQIQRVFSDRGLAPIREVVQETLLPLVPAWMAPLANLAISSADGTADILLERVAARPKQGITPTLRMGFSGRVRWMDQLETRFNDVVLPRQVLPAPHAMLDRLISPDPLASAEVVTTAWDGLGLGRVGLTMAERADLDVTLSVEPPPVRLVARTIDGTEIRAGVEFPPEPVVLTGTVSAEVLDGERISLRQGDLRLRPSGDRDHGVELTLSGDLDLDLQTPGLDPEERATFSGALRTPPDQGTWPQLMVKLASDEAISIGGVQLELALEDLEGGGAVGISFGPDRLEVSPLSPLELSAHVKTPEPMSFTDAQGELAVELNAAVTGSLRPAASDEWLLTAQVGSSVKGRILSRVMSLPELDIHRGILTALFGGNLEAGVRAQVRFPRNRGPLIDLSESRFNLTLDQADLDLEGRLTSLPAGTSVNGRVASGTITPTGPEGVALSVGWDLHQQPCLLHHEGKAISLLTHALRAGELTLHLESTGRMRFSGDRGGLYGVRYFNALLNPAADPEQLLDLVRSDDVLAHVVNAIEAFTPRLAETLTDLRALGLGAERILNREGVKDPKDLVPRRAMARIFSLLLCGTPRLSKKLRSIIGQVTDGKGLDRRAIRKLLQRELESFDIDFELSALIQWLDLVLSPTEPIPSPPPVPELPLPLDPAFAHALEGFPSAGEIYAAAQQDDLPEEMARQLGDLCPRLTRRQLDYLLRTACADDGWPGWLVRRLRHVRGVKLKVEAIAEEYSGPEFALQPILVASFLSEAAGPLPGVTRIGEARQHGWPPPCALGPQEVAVLLQAGQSSGLESKRAQINNRILLELLRREPADFTFSTLVEIGHRSPRALAGFLYAFLDQDQDHMARPLDLAALLQEKLDLEIPRQRDYMAGGRHASESYYQALCEVADQLLELAGPVLALNQHLQVERHPAPTALALQPSAEKLEQRARDCIARADAEGARCTFKQDRGGPRARARDRYRVAFRACARLLQQEPRAFQLPWLREFWARNEEALTVLSVVRGYQEDREDDRRWLHLESGRDTFESEQDLTDTVIRTLYWQEEDRRAVLADPLARLLIEPEPGRLNFSIITCMGVITEGADGRELEQVFERLEERRGVRLIRSPVATARSLEYNAGRIIEAIESCDSPWGIIGYSQGCANALKAESALLSGPPDRRHLLDGLVSRKLLFSAANGSCHGTSGMLKFQRALVQGERHLKHYQAVLSWEAIKGMLRLARAVLDSRAFIHILGGVHSLTYERARDLHRDGQFLDTVPTSRTIGVVAPEKLPETLEFFYNILVEQSGALDQDTQVTIQDAVGYATRVENEFTEVLRRCDMGSLVQATHHWAPLTHEIEFVTTERDRDLAIYESPKDRLVTPWVEVLARFGRIETI